MIRSTVQSANGNRPASDAPKLVDLKDVGHPLIRMLLPLIRNPIEKTFSLDDLNRGYAQYHEKVGDCKDPKQIFDLCLTILKVSYNISLPDLRKIPASGPLVVVANHPFGGIEGVILGAILLQVRSDVKILGNYLLNNIVGVRDTIIAVDPFETKSSVISNLKGLKESVRWLKAGGALITFPAGEVSSFQLKNRKVEDSKWSPHIGGIIRRTDATTLPVYFPGKNSLIFQLLGMLHPWLRTAMLPRELVNKQHSRVSACIGKAIPWRKLQRFETDKALIEFLRFSTFFLKNREDVNNKRFKVVVPLVKNDLRPQMPIVPPVAPKMLEQDIKSIPPQQQLVEKGDLAVYIAESSQIPNVLNEIGRLREITFREVQEGTGRAIDLDQFDTYYLHLFLWNQQQRELVGAYRLGLTDQILKHYGPAGLYTNQLFRYKPEFLGRLNNSIEVGRSFIRSEYQKKFSSLKLIWRGIGEYVSQNPQYHVLFGTVSISKGYQKLSRNLIIRFLKTNKFDLLLSRFVSPRNPFRSRPIRGINQDILKSSFQDIDDISLLISEIEKDGKGIPILLRHYLKLNGHLISFNVDKAFSSVVDGLLLVDLTQTDAKLLKRLMGKNAYEIFKRHYPNQSRAHVDAYEMSGIPNKRTVTGTRQRKDHEAA